MLGNADDVYGLGMCILWMLAMLIDEPWTDWMALNTCSMVYASALRLKMKVLGNILQYTLLGILVFFVIYR